MTSMNKIAWVFILALFTWQCDSMPDWLKDWQSKQVEKRYGVKPDKDKIPEWQQEVKEYEQQIDEKIKAGVKTGKVYRKIGEAFATIESYQLCAENLDKAIDYGYTDPEVFFYKGLCLGNLARRHNWSHKYVKQSEDAFLKVLANDKDFHKARFELGLIYFYGYGKNSTYSVLGDIVTVSQQQFREKAIELITEYRRLAADDPRGYFALAGMHTIMGAKSKAREEMILLTSFLKNEYPDSYASMSEYQQAMKNLAQLGGG